MKKAFQGLIKILFRVASRICNQYLPTVATFFCSIKTSSLSPRATTTAMSILLPANLQQCPSPSLSPSTPLFSPCPSTAFSFGRTRLRCLRLVTSCVASVQSTVANGSVPAPAVVVEREQIRLGLPSKGRMAADSIDLLKVNGVSVPMKICILIIIWLML